MVPKRWQQWLFKHVLTVIFCIGKNYNKCVTVGTELIGHMASTYRQLIKYQILRIYPKQCDCQQTSCIIASIQNVGALRPWMKTKESIHTDVHNSQSFEGKSSHKDSTLLQCLCVELCSPKGYVQVQITGTYEYDLFGNRVFVDVIRWGHTGVG